MAKRPNKLGRIEAEPKPKKDWGKIGRTIAIVALVVGLPIAGVTGTLAYQSFINRTEANGVSKYIDDQCDKYSKDGKSWLECDIK